MALPRRYRLPKIVDMDNGTVTYDAKIAPKQADWTYALDRQAADRRGTGHAGGTPRGCLPAREVQDSRRCGTAALDVVADTLGTRTNDPLTGVGPAAIAGRPGRRWFLR